MDEDEVANPTRSRSRIGVAAALAGGVALAGLLAAWIERKPIVAHFVDDKLAAAHVPASYRLAAIGPFEQRLEDVRIGDPAAPDLVAKSLTLELGYGFQGPYLRAVSADGVRLKARVANGRVSLGAIDRLLPASGNQPLALPDLTVRLIDTRVALDTPAGAIGVAVEGEGNLQDGFRGRLAAKAPLLAAGDCAIRGMFASIDVGIQSKRPTLAGPVAMAISVCSKAGLALGAGKAVINARLTPSLDGGEGGVSLGGFGGRFGTAHFDSVSGLITATGSAKQFDGATGVTLANLASPDGRADKAMLGGRFRFLPGSSGLIFNGDVALRNAALGMGRRKALLAATGALDGSPAEPLARKLGGAADRLLADANGAAHLSLISGGPEGTVLTVRTMALAGRGGAFLKMRDEGAGFGWSARGGAWRADGHFVAGGGGLPALDVRLRQAVAGAPLAGVVKFAPYTAGSARLASTPVRFAVSGGGTRFDTVLTFDGPLPSGQVTGLTVPLAGHLDARGGFAIGQGCIPVAFHAARTGGMSLDATQVRLCGVGSAPILVKAAGGSLRYGAVGTHLRFTGHSGESPLLVTADRTVISAAGISARALAVRIGEGDSLTRLDVATLDGRYTGGVLSGPFEGASAQIDHVPLLLDKMAGEWEFAKGALVLNGGLTVSDVATAPRFEPLIARDATLRFGEGRVDAAARLREPKSDAVISNVDVHHDLSSGAGYATLDVPGITFIPKGLQPEAITPLTLGVIANLNGRIAGQGRIDWDAKGVASVGDFHTDGTDLAAAFGPVSKIAGKIHFSDLLALATPPHQEIRITEINPGIAVSNGVVHYQLLPGQRVQVEDAHWPFAGGTLDLEPSLLSFEQSAQRRLTFRLEGLDAATFVQQLDFPNISATGSFDGTLPIVFDQSGGRIEGGFLKARPGGGDLAYVGELTSAQLGTMGKFAFDALKKIRYQSLAITLDGRLDGEIVSGVTFDGVRQATGDTSMVARMIANLPFRFNVRIRAPFRGLMGSARAFVDPSVLLQNGAPIAPPPEAIQPIESEPVR